jgi:hypothetical protein
MFVDLRYLQVHDGSLENEGQDKDTIDGVSVVKIGGFFNIDGNGVFPFDGVHNDKPKSSFALMNETFFSITICNGGYHN